MKRILLFSLAACLLPCVSHAQSEVLTVHGYSSFEFEKMLGEEGRGDPNGSFDLDLFDLVLDFRPGKNVRVATDLTWEHGAATEDGRGNVAVEYAFAEYFVADWLQVRAGKMFTAFGIYNEIHTAKPAYLTVKEPLSTNKNEKFGSILRFYPRWGAGLAALGDVRVFNGNLDYVLQLTNGEQEFTNPFEEDDNTRKAFGGRVRYGLSNRFTIAGSFYADWLSQPTPDGEVGPDFAKLISYGGHLVWVPEPFGVEIEFVRGSVSPSGQNNVTRHGMTAMVHYTFAEWLTPYFRYEFLDPDTGVADDNASLYIYGINMRVGGVLFLKAELDRITAGNANRRFDGQGYTEFKAAAVVGF